MNNVQLIVVFLVMLGLLASVVSSPSCEPVLLGCLAFCVLVVVCFVWLAEIRKSQLSPHYVTTSMNGHVLDGRWVTNRFYVDVVGCTNLPGQPVAMLYVTNEYWHVWSIFR